MTKGKTTLIQKDLQKETPSNNNWLITYLPMIYVEIYNLLVSRELFSKEQKECHKGTRKTEVYIDQDFLKKNKTRRKMKPWHGMNSKRPTI